MSVKSYIDSLCSEKKLNMKQLAEQVGINYKTLNTLVNEDGRLMNPKQLALFSKYTGKSKQEVFYDNLKDDDLSDACTKTALLYIGKKTCEGWIANIDIRLDTKISNTRTANYAGILHKKRSGNGLTVVEDWDQLKVDFWEFYYKGKLKDEEEYGRDTIARTFANERKYISSVLFFGLQRLCTTNLNPVNYHIVFNRDTEYYLVKDYFPKKMNMGFECIYVDEKQSL
ncbi:helix-turn-helix domain-containing protein [Holdemanella biformis]|uniref:helix-turn-helix domain-containing protein n=1 Tax=Holdemanella biformis TaxID=1735 RepID=UPI003078E2E0